jgi:hypothetical protein
MSTGIPGSDASRLYQSQVAALLGDASLKETKMFGTMALCVSGKVFMFPWRDTLVVKIPVPQASQLIAHAERFDPGHERTCATWAAVFATARDRWASLARQARAFAGG